MNQAEGSCNRAKTYNYLTDDSIESKKGKGTKKCVTKTKLKFKD